jgi:hypothetical protein
MTKQLLATLMTRCSGSGQKTPMVFADSANTMSNKFSQTPYDSRQLDAMLHAPIICVLGEKSQLKPQI